MYKIALLFFCVLQVGFNLLADFTLEQAKSNQNAQVQQQAQNEVALPVAPQNNAPHMDVMQRDSEEKNTCADKAKFCLGVAVCQWPCCLLEAMSIFCCAHRYKPYKALHENLIAPYYKKK